MIPIQGYESKYAITEDGSIFSYRKGSILKPIIHEKQQYPSVTLYNQGRRQHVMIHRLVALHCLPNPNGLPHVNHKDGNKKNYHPDNLEWCTASENVFHGYITGLTPTKLTQEQVDYCRSVCVKGHREFGVRGLARTFGVSSAAICHVINNQTWAPKPS